MAKLRKMTTKTCNFGTFGLFEPRLLYYGQGQLVMMYGFGLVAMVPLMVSFLVKNNTMTYFLSHIFQHSRGIQATNVDLCSA